MGFLSAVLVASALFSLVVGSPTSQPSPSLPPVINNCTGKVRPSLPNQIASAPGYAPQLPAEGSGWEEWVVVLDAVVGDENPLFFLRWGRGDNSAANSTLDDGIFAFWTAFDNGTAYAWAFPGTLVYNDDDDVKTWSVGNNTLKFDGNTGSWSVAIANAAGFHMQGEIDMYARVHVFTSVCPTYSHDHVILVPHQERHSLPSRTEPRDSYAARFTPVSKSHAESSPALPVTPGV